MICLFGDGLAVEANLVHGSTGKQFQVYELDEKDLQNGLVKSPWIPKTHHPSIPPERLEEFSKSMVCSFLLAAARGELNVDSTWNERLPEFPFTDLDAFLTSWFPQPRFMGTDSR